MNILQFIEFNKKKIGLIFVISLCSFVLFPFLSGELPLGRDWSRYWHPHLHYFKAVGTSFGVVWQEGGGFLTSYDPSTLAWDPIWQVINYVFSYGPSISLYLCAYFSVGILSFYFLCARSADALVAALVAVGFAYSGLSLSVLHQQFLPIIFAAPVSVLAFIKFNERSNIKRLILCVVSFYYVGYTAVPNLAILCWIFGFIYSLNNQQLKKYLIVSIYAFVCLIPPYAGLVMSKLAGVAPDSSRWYNWSFSAARIISLIIPEGNFDEPGMIWYSHMFGGDQHKVEPYFRSVLIPLWALGAWISGVIYTKGKHNRVVAVMSVCVLLMSTIGYFPQLLRDIAWFVPVFWSRYPEKFLLIFMPLMFYISAVFISENLNTTKNLLKSQLIALATLLLVGLHNAIKYSDFLKAVNQTKFQPTVLLLASSILFIMGIFIKNKNKKLLLFLISLIVWAPISYLQFIDARGVLAKIVTKRSNFLSLNESLMLNSRVYIHPSASVPYCMNKFKNKNPFACSDYDFGAYFLLSTYTNVSSGSFNNFKTNAYDDIHEQVANYKPNYLIYSKDVFNIKELCSTLLVYDSILTCESATSRDYVGELMLVKISHKNEYKILETSTPAQLDLEIAPMYDSFRVPFFPPPLSKVLLDGIAQKYEMDRYGVVISNLVSGKKYKLTIDYDYRVEKYSALVVFILLTVVTLIFKLGKVFLLIK